MDFQALLKDQPDNLLLATDQLVEMGLSRDVASHLVKTFHERFNPKFQELLGCFKDQADLYERSFLKAAMVARLADWVEERIPQAAFAQHHALSLMIERDEASHD